LGGGTRKANESNHIIVIVIAFLFVEVKSNHPIMVINGFESVVVVVVVVVVVIVLFNAFNVV
jgi:hypothetical protein